MLQCETSCCICTCRVLTDSTSVLFTLFSQVILNSPVSWLLELGVWCVVMQRCRILKIILSSVDFTHDVLFALNKIMEYGGNVHLAYISSVFFFFFLAICLSMQLRILSCKFTPQVYLLLKLRN